MFDDAVASAGVITRVVSARKDCAEREGFWGAEFLRRADLARDAECDVGRADFGEGLVGCAECLGFLGFGGPGKLDGFAGPVGSRGLLGLLGLLGSARSGGSVGSVESVGAGPEESSSGG